jgi:zinc transport system ATP-binding protein
LLLGLERPSSGSIALFGGPLAEGRSLVGYVPQHAGFDPSFPISVREVVRMGRLAPLARRSSGEDAAVERALEIADVADLAARPYGALSGGQRRRVMVARPSPESRAFRGSTEPTANMDAESETQALRDPRRAERARTTILIVTHDTGFVLVADRFRALRRRSGRRKRRQGNRAPSRRAVDGSPRRPVRRAALKVLHGESVADAACCGKAGEGA